MLAEKLAINNKTRKQLIKSVNTFFDNVEQEIGLNNVILEVLSDKDLFLYMVTHSIQDSGIILGKMNYFDDIKVEVPYGITYNSKEPSLNLFTFEFSPNGSTKRPIETLQLCKTLPSKISLGVDTYENYHNYPDTKSFLSSLNKILQMEIKDQKSHWVDFNRYFYP